MKLADYLSEALPITKENFIKLIQEGKETELLKEFCLRMKERGGYGALD